MRKLTLLLLGVLLFAGQVLAQRTVSGRVTDDKGNPVPNASVVVKGKTVGTSTNADGRYTLTLPADAKVLVFSAVDMEPVEASIGAQTAINPVLKSQDKTISEVVVVGYGSKTVRENISSISRVAGKDIAEVPLPSFDQALAGKTAGVQINSTGGVLGDGTAIRVRGINSISLSSQPLIVVDGVPQIGITNTNGFNGGDGTRFNPLALVNPNDIESIDVLKDAGATAIYGSRGANGVIVITTKKGKRGTSKIQADVKFSWSRASRLPEMLNGDQFIAISNEKATNKYGSASPNAIIAKESDINGDGKPDRTDWMSLLYPTGFSKDYSVNMSGGSDKATYFASVRYNDQAGVSYHNRLKTGQARLNLDIVPKTWLKSGVELAYTKTLNLGILSDRYSAGSTVGWQAFPNLAVDNPNGPAGYNLRTSAPIGILDWGNNVRSAVTNNFSQYNPIAAVDLTRQNNTVEETRGTVYGEITPMKGLKLTTRFGIQQIRNMEDQYTSPYLAGLGNPYNGLVQDQEQTWRTWDWQNYLTFDRTFASNHRVGFVAGSEYQKDNYNYFYVGAANFADPFFQYVIDGAYTNVQPGTTTTLNLTGGDLSSSGVESYFSRLNYAYKGKYFVEGSYRADAFSGFGAGHKWGYFPAVSAGWEISKENFMSSVKAIDFLKLRASYGKTGNYRGLGAYQARGLYGGAVYTTSTGLGLSQFANDDLRWETSTKLDIGVEATTLHGRLGAVIDYFKNDISGLLLNAPVPYTTGVPGASVFKNIGGMKNTGWEFTINATPVKTKDLNWTVSFNYTTVKNEVTGLVPENGNADIPSGINRVSVGKELGLFYLPRWAGVDPATGNPMFYAKDGSIRRYNYVTGSSTGTWTDMNGAPVAAIGTDDYVFLDKTGLPKWYGGLSSNLTYKNFDFGFNIMFQGGNYIYNNTRAIMLSNSFLNNTTEILTRWQKPGDITDVPKLWLIDNTANGSSTRFLEKGDFLKMRTITLGYTLPKSILDKLGAGSIRFYGQILNAFTWTGYSGADPEVNTNRFNNISVGTDLRNVPQPRTVLVGIQANF